VLAIEEVREIDADDLSEEDAIAAGYDSAQALLSDLRKRPDGTLYRIALSLSGDDPREALRARDHLEGDELAEMTAQLERLDQAARTGAWTMKCLNLIGERDGGTAAQLAEGMGLDKARTKQRVRRLKDLGLTESLQTGYRLSNRGRALLAILAHTTAPPLRSP
jgi:hypothetical protein